MVLAKLIKPIMALALFASGPVAAQDGEPIVVTAPSRDDGALRRQVSQFSRKIADTVGQEQFARRGVSYCPRIIGLPAPYDRPSHGRRHAMSWKLPQPPHERFGLHLRVASRISLSSSPRIRATCFGEFGKATQSSSWRSRAMQKRVNFMRKCR